MQGQLYFKSAKVPGVDGKKPWTTLPSASPQPLDMFLSAVSGKADLPLVSAHEAADRVSVMEAMYRSSADAQVGSAALERPRIGQSIIETKSLWRGTIDAAWSATKHSFVRLPLWVLVAARIDILSRGGNVRTKAVGGFQYLSFIRWPGTPGFPRDLRERCTRGRGLGQFAWAAEGSEKNAGTSRVLSAVAEAEPREEFDKRRAEREEHIRQLQTEFTASVGRGNAGVGMNQPFHRQPNNFFGLTLCMGSRLSSLLTARWR